MASLDTGHDTRHKFRCRTHHAEHSGLLDDEVAEWLSALFVVIHDDPEHSVRALKAAVRDLASLNHDTP